MRNSLKIKGSVCHCGKWIMVLTVLVFIGCASPKRPTAEELNAQRERDKQAWAEQAKAKREAEQQRMESIAKARSDREAAEQKRISDYLAANPQLDSSLKEAIQKQSIQIGMTRDQVQASWGTPQKTSEYVSANGTTHTWTYGAYTLTFHDGRLYSWFNSLK